MKFNTIPVIGFVAWSGTGKTTLLTKTIPMTGIVLNFIVLPLLSDLQVYLYF